ncbi:MAG: thioesterase family protein [Terrimesophilobacter sp.]
MIFRTILMRLFRRRGRRLQIHDVARARFRVLPTDLDVFRHMNNGVYLSIMDLGRLDLLQRSGAWATLDRLGFYPVVGSETITFRRSLQPWQRYTLETKIIGYDGKAVYVEQRFVVGREVYAVGVVRGRFLRRSGGTVSIPELAQAIGVDVTRFEVPQWVLRWATDVALPPSRAVATSDWS